MTTWPTALVTGASGGIGACFTDLLAEAGSDLVLVARSEDRLVERATALRARYGVRVEVLPADLTDPGDLDRVCARLADPDAPVDLLVNNAGAGSRPPRAFRDADLDAQLRTVALNVVAPLRLSHAVLPQLVGRRAGGILTVSSVAAWWPQPHGATYAASKAFLSSFGETLGCELADSGVTVTTLVPGFTRRGDGKGGGPRSFTLPDFAWLEREQVAREGLAALAAGRPECIPGLTYRLAQLATRLLPRPVVRTVFTRLWG